jgi:dephospho-CoA kinase
VSAGAKSKRPLIIGLTGSIGMGKSTVAVMFEEEGIAVFDADAVVHKLQGPGGALVADIESAFPGTTGTMGVDRQILGAAVLANKQQLTRLEAIIHPAVAHARAAFLESHAADEMIVFDIPLLFEKGGQGAVDTIIVVSAPADIQRSRVLARPGMTQEKFEQILGLQIPDAEKRIRADHVIDTRGPIEETRSAVKKIIKKLRKPLAHHTE